MSVRMGAPAVMLLSIIAYDSPSIPATDGRLLVQIALLNSCAVMGL